VLIAALNILSVATMADSNITEVNCDEILSVEYNAVLAGLCAVLCMFGLVYVFFGKLLVRYIAIEITKPLLLSLIIEPSCCPVLLLL